MDHLLKREADAREAGAREMRERAANVAVHWFVRHETGRTQEGIAVYILNTPLTTPSKGGS
jgi:hypothetical protein